MVIKCPQRWIHGILPSKILFSIEDYQELQLNVIEPFDMVIWRDPTSADVAIAGVDKKTRVQNTHTQDD